MKTKLINNIRYLYFKSVNFKNSDTGTWLFMTIYIFEYFRKNKY